ncbi:hypothetical protein EDB85DRAFT_1274082 [Lactarius pseudohatsudake]|nr:hypothetical protein EDB85DRAFT_1274082 [Lactarius pseudohatsudake]
MIHIHTRVFLVMSRLYSTVSKPTRSETSNPKSMQTTPRRVYCTTYHDSAPFPNSPFSTIALLSDSLRDSIVQVSTKIATTVNDSRSKQLFFPRRLAAINTYPRIVLEILHADTEARYPPPLMPTASSAPCSRTQGTASWGLTWKGPTSLPKSPAPASHQKPHAVKFPCQLQVITRPRPLWFRKGQTSVDGVPHRRQAVRLITQETEMDHATLRASCEYKENPCRASSRLATFWLNQDVLVPVPREPFQNSQRHQSLDYCCD